MRAVPWLLVAGLLAWAFWQGRGVGEAVGRAEAAEAVADSLAPIVDSLKAVAVRRDTVIVTVLDSVRVVVERERIVQIAVVDTLRATLDSVQAVMLDELVASHAAEVEALETATREALLWGQSWKDVAEAQTAEIAALRLSSQAWEAAARAGQRSKWTERAVFVLGAGCILFCPRPS